MTWLERFRLLRLVPLLAPLFAVPALAQFEVSPDHFDSSETAHKPTARNKASVQPTILSAAHRTTGVAVATAHEKAATARNTGPSAGSLSLKQTAKQTPSKDRAAGISGKTILASESAQAGAPMRRRE